MKIGCPKNIEVANNLFFNGSDKYFVKRHYRNHESQNNKKIILNLLNYMN